MNLISIMELAKEKEKESIRDCLVGAWWEDGRMYKYHDTLLTPAYFFNQCMVNKRSGLNHALNILSGKNKKVPMGTSEHHEFGAFLIGIFG